MSSTVTVGPAKGARGIGLFALIAGLVLIVAGVLVWLLVANQLADENIRVSDDAIWLEGRSVAGPFTAYAQAQVIEQHALEASGGRTYAELGQDDPLRATVMNASFLRASLFTSIVAFGLSALVIGLGLVLALVGAALRSLASGPQVAITTPGLTSAGELSMPGRHAEPARREPEPEPEPRPAPHPAPTEPPRRASTRSPAEAPPVRRGQEHTTPLPYAPPRPEPRPEAREPRPESRHDDDAPR